MREVHLDGMAYKTRSALTCPDAPSAVGLPLGALLYSSCCFFSLIRLVGEWVPDRFRCVVLAAVRTIVYCSLNAVVCGW